MTVRYDSIVRRGRVVFPDEGDVVADLGIREGRIATIADELDAPAAEIIDAEGMLVVPGAVDAHTHLGIYRDLSADTESETTSALVGGVTTVVSYFRTGSHYLNRSGPYAEIFPDVLEAVRGRARTDYGFHLAPMLREHVAEIPALVDAGVTSFKFYMFYAGLNLAGDSTDAAAYTKSSVYDLGFLFEIMEAVARENDRRPGRVSVSIHCEQPALISFFSRRVAESGLTGLEAYSAGRPPLTERVAVGEAGTLARHARVPVNLLHLSSEGALDAATEVRRLEPTLDLRRETTLHHLALNWEMFRGAGHQAKVNPPIRSARDVDALWAGVRDGRIDWVVSDHACCQAELKEGSLESALPGFGGTSLLYPTLLTLGWKQRGIPLSRVVSLVSRRPADAYNLGHRKGRIAVGYDADLAIIDPEQERPVTAERLLSAQEYTPFEGLKMIGWPEITMLRGRVVFRDGRPVDQPAGEFIPRRAD